MDDYRTKETILEIYDAMAVSGLQSSNRPQSFSKRLRSNTPNGAGNCGDHFPKLDWRPGRQAVQELVDRRAGDQGSRDSGFLGGYDMLLLSGRSSRD